MSRLVPRSYGCTYGRRVLGLRSAGRWLLDAVENGIILVWRGFELVRVPVPFVEECRIGGLYEESEPANLAMVAPECLV